MDRSIRTGINGEQLTDEMRIVEHFCAMSVEEIDRNLRELYTNTDETMRHCAATILRQVAELPNSEYAIPEKTPDETAFGTGRVPDQTHVPQFGTGSRYLERTCRSAEPD